MQTYINTLKWCLCNSLITLTKKAYRNIFDTAWKEGLENGWNKKKLGDNIVFSLTRYVGLSNICYTDAR